MIPRARPFVASLWGAITDAKVAEPKAEGTRRRPKDLFFIRRIDHPISWLTALVGSPDRLTRTFLLSQRRQSIKWAIRTDASPFGMGGILVDSTNVAQEYWADPVGSLDFDRFKASRGDPAFQAEWEL